MVEKFDFLNPKQIELCDAFFNKERSVEQLEQDLKKLGIECYSEENQRPFITIVKELADKLLEAEVEQQNGYQ